MEIVVQFSYRPEANAHQPRPAQFSQFARIFLQIAEITISSQEKFVVINDPNNVMIELSKIFARKR